MTRLVGRVGGTLSLAAIALLFAATGFGCSGDDGPTNVILITVDDLGWRDVGCFGSTRHDTPNIDSMCAAGVKFTNAYAASAVCSPTRAAIVSGRYPARTGVTDWIRRAVPGKLVEIDGSTRLYRDEPRRELLLPDSAPSLPLEEVTIAEILAEQGYRTAHIGKWHLGPRASVSAQGFAINLGGTAEGQPPSYFDPYTRGRQRGIAGLPARKAGEYLTDREADEAVRFLRENRNKPFFLNLWHHAVHAPIQGRPDLVEKYKTRWSELATDPPVTSKAAYAAMVESVDESLGRILETLDELGLARRTLVLFTSDNGGRKRVTSNAPLRGGKGQPFEGGIRVPQIALWQGHTRAGVSHQAVNSIDLLPTIADATGVAVPASIKIDGLSLMGLLEAPATATLARSALYWHYPHYRKKEPPYSIIRKGRLKLIRRYEGRRFGLFDLEADIGEQNDLSNAMPERVTELDRELDAWLREIDAALPLERSSALGVEPAAAPARPGEAADRSGT
jgi:arylsulfatase A